MNVRHRIVEADDVIAIELLCTITQYRVGFVHDDEVLLELHRDAGYRYGVSVGSTGVGHRPNERIVALLSNETRTTVVNILNRSARSREDAPCTCSPISKGGLHPHHRSRWNGSVGTGESLGRHLHIGNLRMAYGIQTSGETQLRSVIARTLGKESIKRVNGSVDVVPQLVVVRNLPLNISVLEVAEAQHHTIAARANIHHLGTKDSHTHDPYQGHQQTSINSFHGCLLFDN